jgi:hypothetical protein
MMPNNETCQNCIYWKNISDYSQGSKCCHYLLIKGTSRQRDGDKCLSYEAKKEG